MDLHAGLLAVRQALGWIGRPELHQRAQDGPLWANDSPVRLHRCSPGGTQWGPKSRESGGRSPDYKDDGLVFATSVGTPIHTGNLFRAFKRLQELAKVPRIRFHDLRHSHASLLLAQGENPRLIAKRSAIVRYRSPSRFTATFCPGPRGGRE